MAIGLRSEFEAFRRENAEQHRDVARRIDLVQAEVLERVDGVHARVDRLSRWVAGVLLSVAGGAVMVLLGAFGWALARLFEQSGGGL